MPPACRNGKVGANGMIVIAGLVLGAIFGAVLAARRGGKRLDILQYAAGFGIAFCLLGLFVTIFIERMVT